MAFTSHGTYKDLIIIDHGNCLEHGFANFFYRGPDGQCFWLCGPYGLSHNYATLLCHAKTTTDNRKKNECAGCQ